MTSYQLEPSNYIELVELLETADIETIKFTPLEAKALFDLDEPVASLSDFQWIINAATIEGRIDGKRIYYPPRQLTTGFLEPIKFHPKAIQGAIVGYITSKITADQFIAKLQQILYDKYNYLSQGQAETIIKRYIGMSLTSSERNNITKIRQKIESCRMMIAAFDGMLSKGKLDSKIRNWDHYQLQQSPEIADIQDQAEDSLKFFCYECQTYLSFPSSDKPVHPPIHHDTTMSLSWGGLLSAEESTATFRELKERLQNPELKPVNTHHTTKTNKIPKLSLYCTTCQQFFEMDEEIRKKLDQEEPRVKLPEHHGKPMEIRIGERKTDQEKMKQLQAIGEALVDNFNSTGLYICKECKLILEFDNTDEYTPQHHGKDMSRIRIDSSKSQN